MVQKSRRDINNVSAAFFIQILNISIQSNFKRKGFLRIKIRHNKSFSLHLPKLKDGT